MSFLSSLVNRNTPNTCHARIAMTIIALSVLAACGKKPDAAGAGAPPPTEVAIVTVAPQRLAITDELPGRLEATRVAQVRARVPGILLKRIFREGSDVKAGQPLFRIDPAPLQAACCQRAGQRWRAPRPTPRRPRRWPSATSRWSKPTRSASRNTPTPSPRRSRPKPMSRPAAPRVQTAADQPRLRHRDRADLGPHRPRAGDRRRAGRPGRGDAAGADPADQPDVRQLHAVGDRRAATCAARWRAASSSAPSGAKAASVRVVLEDGSDYPQAGKLLFSDLTVDPTTGQITLRAEVPNPKRHAAARHVRARAARAGADAERHRRAAAGGARAPSRATRVMVVGADGKVAPRPVKIGAAQRQPAGSCSTA